MKSIATAIMLSGAAVFGLGVSPLSAQHGQGEHENGTQERGEKGGHSDERVEGHGGVVTMSKEFYVETVFMPDQVRLYLYDSSQNPIHVQHWKKGLVEAMGVVDFRDRGRGTTTLRFVHGAPGGYACPMHADQVAKRPGKCTRCGMNLAKQDIPDGTLWSCPMHADENGRAQGRCGDCGMKYTPQDYLFSPADFNGLKAGDAMVAFNFKNLPGSREQTLQFTEKFVPAKMRETPKKGEDGHSGHDRGGHDHDH